MKKNLLYIALLFASLHLYSQKKETAKADKDYNQYAYIDAIKTYERIFEKGYKSPEMLQKLGNSYYFSANLEKAAKWYGELFLMTEDLAPEYYYRYAQSLKAVKQYEKADEMIKKFNEKSGNDRRAKLAAEQKDYLSIIKKNSGRYIIADAGINSENSDYGTAVFGDTVVFSSARKSGKVYTKKAAMTGEAFTNLYLAKMNPDGSLLSTETFPNQLNSKYHEATPVFTKDRKTVYFTRNNYLGKKRKDEKGTVLLKIYKATLKNKKWSNITELPFNSNNYSVAHPALSPDEKYLYFASDMSGTIGQSDIFRVAINSDGTFGPPENLGEPINTEGRETFPFITSENELYFASDGHPGLGGLDVFVSKLEKDGKYKNVLNTGEPLNSPSDDFAMQLDFKTKIGYVSSNRTGGQGGDDIYRIKETKTIEYPCEQFLNGIVTDKETQQPLADSKLTLFDSNFKLLKEMKSDINGKFDFGQVDCDSKYYIKAEKEEFTTIEVPAIIADQTGETFVPLTMEKIIKKMTIGDDLAKAFDIKVIYFDLDKSDIRRDAELDLVKILDVMEQNPTLQVDIRSHTDSRQSKIYNDKLSDRRAKATMNWLIKNGINKSRLKAKGYGETQLVNKCSDGVKCTEEEHQANRRSEFIIIK